MRASETAMVQTIETRMFRSLPNGISILRVLLVPFGVWLAEDLRSARLLGEAASSTPLALLLLGLGLSDVLDGWLARRYGLATNVGATLDAVADKLAQFVFVSYFTFREIPSLTALPIWFFFVVFARDLVLALGLAVARVRGDRVSTEHRVHGKVSSLLLSFVILSVVFDVPQVLTLVGCWIAAVSILISTAAYVTQGARSTVSP